MKNCLIVITATIVILTGPALLPVTVYAQEQPAVAASDAPAAAASDAPDQSAPIIAAPDAEGVFPSLVHHGDITEFLKFLSVASHINIVPSYQVKGTIEVNLFDVSLNEVLEAVLIPNGFTYDKKGRFIYVYTQKEYDQIKAAAMKMETKVFHLNYISAQDAQDLITPMLSQTGKITTTPEAIYAEKAEGLGENWAGSSYIVVVDYPQYLDKISDLIDKIDRRPPQVLVEATILVVSLDDLNELGVDFNVLGGVDFQGGLDPSTSVAGGFHAAFDPADVQLGGTKSSVLSGFAGNVTSGGLSVGIIKNNLGLFVSALESITDVTTLGNPKVLTVNRQVGVVRVGRDEGYLTAESTATTTIQNVKMLETGTTLKFRPFVMDDGRIRMELHPEDSSGKVVIKGDFALPEKTTTQVTTNVLVKDGNTIVIGGLFREKTSINRSQIPLLGDIPVLGALFRSTSDQNTKEEVIFLITPHIVNDPVDYAAADEVKENINELLLGARESMQWHCREAVAAAHYNKAQELKEAGKSDSACWYSDLALNASPMFLDALKLRDELRAKNLYTGEYGSMRSFMKKLLEKNSSASLSKVSPGDQAGG